MLLVDSIIWLDGYQEKNDEVAKCKYFPGRAV